MSIESQTISSFYEKLKKVLPFLNGNKDDLVLYYNNKNLYLERFAQLPCINGVGFPAYYETLNKMIDFFGFFRSNKYVEFQSKEEGIVNKNVLIPVYTSIMHYDSAFSVDSNLLIYLCDGTVSHRNDYGFIKNLNSNILNNQIIGWNSEAKCPLVPYTTGKTPLNLWKNLFLSAFGDWADWNIEKWRIGGLDVKYKRKIQKGTYVVSTTETYRASTIGLRCIPHYDSDGYVDGYSTKSAPIIYKTSSSMSAIYTAGDIVSESDWLEFNVPWSYSSPVNTVQDLIRRTYGISPIVQCDFSSSDEGKNKIIQETKLICKSMTYTPCLNYTIKGILSSTEYMFHRRLFWIPETDSWPESTSDVYIDYDHGNLSAINPRHFFNEIENRDLTDSMTDTFDVFAKTTFQKFTNPYNYKIQLRIRYQKNFDGDASIIGQTEFETKTVNFTASPKDKLDWLQGVSVTNFSQNKRVFSDRIFTPTGMRTVYRDGLEQKSPLLTDGNEVLVGDCYQYYNISENNTIAGNYTEIITEGWLDFLDIQGSGNPVKGNYIDTLRTDLYETEEIDVELGPGESYILEITPSQLWEGTSSVVPNTFEQYKIYPADNRINIEPEMFNNTVLYRITYCWRPVQDDDDE